MTRCYEKAKSLDYSVFAMNNHSNCYTSPSAWTTYKKYGQINCTNSRSIEVFQIRKGILFFTDLDMTICLCFLLSVFLKSVVYHCFKNIFQIHLKTTILKTWVIRILERKKVNKIYYLLLPVLDISII